MSKTHSHIAPFTASDIQKYLDGELSAAEMHRMEKAALEDPFLADAIDGYSAHPNPPTIGQDIANLQQRLDAKVGKKKRSLPLWTRIAVAVVILFGLGVIARRGLQKTTTADIAQSPAVTQPAPAPALEKADSSLAAAPYKQKPAPDKEASGQSTPASTQSEPAPAAKQSAASTATQLISTDKKAGPPVRTRSSNPATAAQGTLAEARKPEAQTPAATAPARNNDMARTQADKIPGIKVSTDTVPYNTVANATYGKVETVKISSDSIAYFKDVVMSRDRKAKSLPALKKATIGSSNQTWANYGRMQPAGTYNFAVTGVVTDQNNKPLPGATLFLSGNENSYVITNQEGGFKLPLGKKDSTQQLNVYLSGYKTASLDIQSLEAEAAPAVIRLQPQRNNLQEVVITGYGKSRKETRVQAPSEDNDEKLDSFWLKATPIIGRLQFLQYLIAGKATIHADTSIKGDVLISFDVDRQGQLTDFKIEQSLSPIHDAGVIRLISEGPHWRLLKGRHTRALVKVSF